MKAIILAAGRGSRLQPITDKIPKPLVRIGGETLVERHLKALATASVTEVVINLSYLGRQIEEFVGDGTKFGIDVHYSREGNKPLETLGGILKALPLLQPTNDFVVINSDIWTDYCFKNLKAPTLKGHVVLAQKPGDVSHGDFDLTSGIVTQSRFNPFIFTGISTYNMSAFSELVLEQKKLGPLLRKWAISKNLTGELHAGLWFDIGTKARLKRAQLETQDYR